VIRQPLSSRATKTVEITLLETRHFEWADRISQRLQGSFGHSAPATLPQPRKRAPPMRIRLSAVTWPHDMSRRELSSNHASHMQGRPTGYFLSEHVHVCEIFQKSRTREHARPGSTRIGEVGPFRTASPSVRGSLDHSNNVQTGQCDWGMIGTSRSHLLARICARRARVVKTDPEKWSMHVCANKHAHPTTASIDPCCGETHDISG